MVVSAPSVALFQGCPVDVTSIETLIAGSTDTLLTTIYTDWIDQILLGLLGI
jgi:hypothetical protein